jgi:hypothetical protein
LARKKTRLSDDPDAPLEDAPLNAVADPETPPAEGVRTEPPPEPTLLAAPAAQTDGPPETSPAAPVASLAADPPLTLAQIQDRIDRLEQALAPLQRLDGLEERLLQRVTTYIDRTKPEAPVATTQIAEPSILAKASALGAVGKQLLTTMVMPAVLSSPSPSPSSRARPWAIREILAELQAMFYMYVDPRYRLSWPGRIVPPVLLGLFLTTDWWAPYFMCGLGWLLRKPIEILLCFSLIKLLSYEARRYRDTAPDLPSSLRP